MGLSSKQVAADGTDTLGWPQYSSLRSLYSTDSAKYSYFQTGNAWLDIPSLDGQTRNDQQQQQQLRCPRCDSHNTKFCYYNNYSRMQPRHFCKACRRYWTAGGILRNVPVGGGHKNKRHKKAAQENINPSEADPFRVLNSEQFSHGDPDAFHRIMVYPGGGGEAMSLLSPPLMLPETTMTETYSGISPPPVSDSSSSSHLSNLLTLMPAGSTTEWLQDPPSLLSSFYSPWWDDAGELAAFGQPAAANDQQEP